MTLGQGSNTVAAPLPNRWWDCHTSAGQLCVPPARFSLRQVCSKASLSPSLWWWLSLWCLLWISLEHPYPELSLDQVPANPCQEFPKCFSKLIQWIETTSSLHSVEVIWKAVGTALAFCSFPHGLQEAWDKPHWLPVSSAHRPELISKGSFASACWHFQSPSWTTSEREAANQIRSDYRVLNLFTARRNILLREDVILSLPL